MAPSRPGSPRAPTARPPNSTGARRSTLVHSATHLESSARRNFTDVPQRSLIQIACSSSRLRPENDRETSRDDGTNRHRRV